MRNPFKYKIPALIIRFVVFAVLLILYLSGSPLMAYPEPFLERFSLLHLLWLFWLLLFASRIFPFGQRMTAGRKVFGRYAKIVSDYDKKELRRYSFLMFRRMIIVGICGIIVISPLWILYLMKIADPTVLVLASAFLFSIDLICEIFYCPFQRLIMKNKCCHTCRIYTGDSFMVVSPLLVIPSFFSWSLILVSLISVLYAELIHLTHPEYFWEGSNAALRCNGCEKEMCAVRGRG